MQYAQAAQKARIKVLEMIHRAQTSHIGSNFSVIDIATVLYANLKEEDRVVWSKGWAAATIYYFLAQQGKIPKEDLDRFPHAPYLGLAEPSVAGVEVSGGAMGHGLPVAVGIATGLKRSNQKGRVFCIMSDGEMQEGTTWESAAIAAHHKLDNLTVLVDVNGWCAMGRTKDVVDFEPLEEKWNAFGWFTDRVNGHHYHELGAVIENPMSETGLTKPHVLLCDTIKGKGVSFMEDHLLYHYKQVSDEEYQKAMEELS